MTTIYLHLITDTHGCGKSTLFHFIGSEQKKENGYNAIVLSETVRESPFPINRARLQNSTLYNCAQTGR
jgi:ABC-type lipoprotein export system ATPase subunit